MSVIERIYSTLDSKNLKAVDLCNFIGIKTSTMSTWRARQSDPPIKHIMKICEFLEISCEFLLTGKEDSVPLPTPTNIIKNNNQAQTEDEIDLLASFRKLSRKEQRQILVQMDDIIDKKDSVAAEEQDDTSLGKSLA